MIVTKKAMSRRSVLRGLGVTLALPLLDGMIPALTALSQTAAKPIRRLGIVYVPNGMIMEQWTPVAEGAGFDLTPILTPLGPFRDQSVVVSGLTQEPAQPLPGEGAGNHARASAAFLTGTHAKKTEGSDLQAGTSMDQIAARELGRETQLASLELALDSEYPGACDGGYSCAYVNTLSWSNPTTPLPMEVDPRAVFERLFGTSDSTDRTTRLARLRRDRSLLDSVTQDIASLQKGLGPQDRRKLTQYLEAVRDIERRIQKAEEQSSRELPVLDRPAGVPYDFEDHVKLMFDLQLLAYQTDLTRVCTFMVGREVSGRSYPQIGVPDQHHGVSHHGNNPEKIAKVAKIDLYHTTLFANYLDKLRSTPDGDGSLLDHTLILYGSGMSNGDKHRYDSLPILVAGGDSGQLKGGRHIRCETDTPLMNLCLTLLDKVGVRTDGIGDSNGQIDQLTL